MNFSPKTKKRLIIGYVGFLVISAIYVRSVLKNDQIEVEEREKEGKSVEIKPAKVFLQVKSGTKPQTYETSLMNVDTVLDLIEDLAYEKTQYSYGTELDNINNQPTPEGYDWKVYYEGKDITYEIADWNLEDEKTYELVLTKTAR